MNQDNQDVLGQNIGHIRVVDLIGEGGMGAVYAGFDTTLHRKVALKAIHSGFRFSEDAKARFLREARILSQLDNPYVCTIHDFIQGDEADYLVMELVEGTSLRAALKSGLGSADTMKIAEQLLEVLVDVHGQGVMHRDLKPENIMVTGDGSIKVLDFGLSRSVDEDRGASGVDTLIFDSSDESGDLPEPRGQSVYVRTRLGTVLGTAGYMSPEQARGEPATAASDMYSFGLILQEMLTGEPPFEQGLEPAELLSRAKNAETQPVAGVASDLSNFVSRLKSAAPGARPSSVDALAKLRWIVNKPARRRRRLMVAAVWLALILLSGGLALQSLRAFREARRAEAGEQQAQLEASTSKQVADFLVRLFEVSDPNKALGNTITAREILDRGAEEIESELEDEPILKARLMRTMGRVYHNLGLYDEAEALLRKALEEQREAQEEESADTAAAMHQLAVHLLDVEQFDEARELLEEAAVIQERVLGPDHPDLAFTLSNLGYLFNQLGLYDESRSYHTRALAIREAAVQPDPVHIAASLSNLAIVADEEGDFDTGRELLERVVVLQEENRGPDHPILITTLNNLAVIMKNQGDYAAAIENCERALAIGERVHGPNHEEVGMVLTTLATAEINTEDYDAAVTHLERAAEIYRSVYGSDHTSLAITLGNLSIVLSEIGDYAAAQQSLAEAREIFEKSLGPRHHFVASCYHNEGIYLRELGDYRAALPLVERGLEIREEALGPDHPHVGDSMHELAILYDKLGDDEATEASFRRALQIREDKLGTDHPEYLKTLEAYAQFLRVAGRIREAEEIERNLPIRDTGDTS